METLRDLHLVRAVPASGAALLRAADAGDDQAAADSAGLGVMEVMFSRFDIWYEIESFWEGTFLERTVKGAFAKTMRESKDSIVSLFNHGHDFSIGDKVLGTIDEMSEESDGPLGLVSLFDTSYNRDLVPGLRAGAYGSSFMFRVLREEWDDEPGTSDHNPKGLPERTIKEVRLFEFGPVTWPANPDATAGMRAAGPVIGMTDDYYNRLRARDPKTVDSLLARARALRTPKPDAAHVATDTGTSGDGAARSTDAPTTPTTAGGHPEGLSHARRARYLAHPDLLEAKAS